MSKNIEPHVLQQYKVVQEMGSGAYGHVWEVQSRKTGQRYALKKVFDAFRNSIDAQRTYREVEVLYRLKHTNIIELVKVMKSRNKKDLYLIFEFMEADLHSVVGTGILQKMHQIYTFHQMLKALRYLHSADLIHRDLKPSNVLINSQCLAKICDFGLVRSINCEKEEEMILSEEVATKWYRAPELLLGSRAYGKPIDVWSFGCIIAEILLGKPIFSGNSTLNQLEKILEFTGRPCRQDILSLDSPVAEQLFDQIKVKKKSQRDFLGSIDPEFHGLLCSCFEINPSKRITIEDALKLPLFSEFHAEYDSMQLCPEPIVPTLDDNFRLNVKRYRDKIYEDIVTRYGDTSSTKIIEPCRSLYSRERSEKHRSLTQNKVVSKKKTSTYSVTKKYVNTPLITRKSASTGSIKKYSQTNPYVSMLPSPPTSAKKRPDNPLAQVTNNYNSVHQPGKNNPVMKGRFRVVEKEQSKLLKKCKSKGLEERKNLLKKFVADKSRSLHKFPK